jgi:glycerol kinase
MHADSGAKLSELRVDGGAVANDLLMQFQADVLQIPVVRPKTTETTALGAAYLAGLAVGFWRSKNDLAEHWRIDKVFEPKMPADKAESLKAAWHEAVKRSLDWAV